MAKTIKFNLICDGKPVRNIDDLRENFSIDDVLNYYENKLLQRWLKVRGYEEELRKVEEISSSKSGDIVKKLISIFDVETTLAVVEENIYILDYRKKREALLREYELKKNEKTSVVADYHAGYYACVSDILENKRDMPKIKAAIGEICENYYHLYLFDYRRLFWIFAEDAPMALFAMLTNDKMRKLYLPDKSLTEKAKEFEKPVNLERFILQVSSHSSLMTSDVAESHDDLKTFTDFALKDTTAMYNRLIKLITSEDKLKEILGDNLRMFSGETDDYWKDLEPKGNRFMILTMPESSFIRSAGDSKGDLKHSEIDGNFLILDGIDYKSKTETKPLIYMEV
jgi:hypothetical protein